MSRPLRVAIVAPSLAILGGQSVQAMQLAQGWANDPEVQMWLVPINPAPPRPLRSLAGRKYVRTLLTQASYWPLLWRELRHADVVHVFSASYHVVRALDAAGDTRRRAASAAPFSSTTTAAKRRITCGGRDCACRTPRPASICWQRPGGSCPRCSPRSASRHRSSPTSSTVSAFRFRERGRLRPRFLSTRNLQPPLQRRVHAQGVSPHPNGSARCVAHGGGTGGSELPRLRTLAASLGLTGVEFAGRVPPAEMPRYYAEADVYLQSPNVDNMPLSVLEAFASGTASGFH